MYYKILSEMNLFKPAKIFLAIALVIFIGAPKAEAKYAKLVKVIPYIFAGVAGMGTENVRARNTPCTNLVRNYTKQRNIDLERLAYKRRNGEDTQYIVHGMGSRREEYEHQAAKKGCASLDGILRPNVHSSAQSPYYR